jgi:hypothetical protein
VASEGNAVIQVSAKHGLDIASLLEFCAGFLGRMKCITLLTFAQTHLLVPELKVRLLIELLQMDFRRNVENTI